MDVCQKNLFNTDLISSLQQEYLIKLGNTECHPEQFLERRSKLDKLLIIIQNEDIAGFIHKVDY